MPNLGTTELIIILVIVIIIFGAGKLGSVGSALGKGVSDFRKSVKSETDDETDDSDVIDEPKKVSAIKKTTSDEETSEE